VAAASVAAGVPCITFGPAGEHPLMGTHNRVFLVAPAVILQTPHGMLTLETGGI